MHERNKNMKKNIISIIILILGIVFIPIIVFGADCKAGTVCLENPLGEKTDITIIMGNLVATALGIMGSLALLVFIVGGFIWMTAGGSAEKVKKGTQSMMWASIGIVVIFSSYAIIRLVLGGIGAVPDTGTQAKTTQELKWCLLPEKECVKGDGGPCPGQVFTTQELCEKAKK